MTELVRRIIGSAHDTGLEPESVHMIATSPPYMGLRSYQGEQDVDWPAVYFAPMPGLDPIVIPAMRCGLGAEDTPEAYIGHLVLVMREMWRVLRKDGVCFVNLGDSYAGNRGNTEDKPGFDNKAAGKDGANFHYAGAGVPNGLKPKDLMQIPARFSLAVQADGWWVRSNIPWIKRNGMPGSQTDRPTTGHETIFVLAKSTRYFWDQNAIRKPLAETSWGRLDRKIELMERTGAGTLGKQVEDGVNPDHAYAGLAMGRNGKTGYSIEGSYRRTTDWWFDSLDEQIAHLLDVQENGGPLLDEDGMIAALQVNTAGYSQAHFATWPPLLVQPMILAGTSARGVCPQCGAPHERVVEREFTGEYNKTEGQQQRIRANTMSGGTETVTLGRTEQVSTTTTGWRPTCEHGDLDPIPAIVLDCFGGSGTTAMVSVQLGRRAIYIDVSDEYCKLAEGRTTTQIGMGL